MLHGKGCSRSSMLSGGTWQICTALTQLPCHSEHWQIAAGQDVQGYLGHFAAMLTQAHIDLIATQGKMRGAKDTPPGSSFCLSPLPSELSWLITASKSGDLARIMSILGFSLSLSINKKGSSEGAFVRGCMAQRSVGLAQTYRSLG